MPAKPRPGKRGLYLEIDEALAQRLEALAAGNGRPVNAEAAHAFERHLAAPPRVRVETPPLPEAAVVRPAEPPRKRGPRPGTSRARQQLPGQKPAPE